MSTRYSVEKVLMARTTESLFLIASLAVRIASVGGSSCTAAEPAAALPEISAVAVAPRGGCP